MSNIKFPRKTFEKEIGKLDEKMQNKIAMFGTPLESFDDEEIELEIFPNRPDLLSYQGFKRGFLAFLGKKTGLKEYKINKPQKDFVVKIDNSLKDIRPYTTCAIVKGLKFNDDKIKEMIDIQEKLHLTVGRKRKKVAIGIYPLEQIKLPITFTALEPDKIRFQPLESPREMSGLEILQRHPAGKNYAHLLAGKQKFPIFMDANKNILSLPPIINSHKTGKITEKTKDIFIECSGFNFEILNKCLNILVTTLAEMGGTIYQMELEYKGKKEITPNLAPEKMKISLENTNKLLGLNLNEKQLKQNLEKMGHNYNKGKTESPSWRTDLLHEVDLIEDVAIAYGFDNFVPEIPSISTIGQEEPKETIKRKISEILTGLNFLEISNYHLTTKRDQFTKMGIPEKKESHFIEVENSKTEYNILRKNLTHYLMKIASENIDAEYPQKIFEIGKVFENKKDIVEKENLSLAITPGNFTELKQILEYLFRMLKIEIKLEEPEEFPNHFIDGRCAEIKIKDKSIGFLGEVHPKILKNWRVKMPIALLEISLKEIFEELLE
jgi:phenylalanyl-tRNA synthetase beta chain